VIDSIALSLHWSKLVSIAEEGAMTIKRTAFSRIVSDAQDYSCVLLDAEGDLIAQPLRSLPEFVGSLQQVARHFLREFPPDRLAPGDTLMTNDPWLNTSQTNDFSLLTPIWRDGNVVAYAASVAHSPDVGGRLLSVSARDVFEEGVCYPMCKLWDGGARNDVLWAILTANCRLPAALVGDLEAQRAAHFVMERLLQRFMDDEALADIEELAAAIKNHSEAAVRRSIALIPDGTYYGAVEMDGLGRPVLIQCAVTVDGSRITIDFQGTSPVLEGTSLNCGLNYSTAEAIHTALLVCRPDAPVNAGSLRPFTVSAPAGCAVNAQRPTAVGARTLVVQFITSAVLQALAQAVPDRVLAEPAAPVWPIVISGTVSGHQFIESILLNGGLGAHAAGDGLLLGFPAPVISTKVEVLEADAPVIVESNEYAPDTGGAGQFRGGPGQTFYLRSTEDSPLFVTLRAERIRRGAGGVNGGRRGAPGYVALNGAPLTGKETLTFRQGDVLELQTPGGGGYGDPAKRAPALVMADVRNGVVSAESAERDYGWRVTESEVNFDREVSSTASGPTLRSTSDVAPTTWGHAQSRTEFSI
jgi:N-methylhydantoinase B